MTMVSALFRISEMIIVGLVAVPIARFLLYQWGVRRQEFLSRLAGTTLSLYLSHFHGRPRTDPARGDISQFETFYNKLAGRHLYIMPAAMLLVIVALLGGLVASTAIRSGYEQYVRFYAAQAVPVNHLTVAELDYLVYPFHHITVSLDSLAAIAGAYLYTVVVVIQGFRARTLVPSDLLWCSFRMMIAVPLGLSLSQMLSPSMGGFIAFALGAFPTEEMLRILRRLLSKYLNITENETSDQLVQLSGVTPEVAAVLAGEGIHAIQQLACMDPVALAVRSGLSFDYLLNLVAQSEAWCFIGSPIGKLTALGLGDARQIAKLSKRLDRLPPDAEAHQVLKAASIAMGLDIHVLRSLFREIAEDDYTGFLWQATHGHAEVNEFAPSEVNKSNLPLPNFALWISTRSKSGRKSPHPRKVLTQTLKNGSRTPVRMRKSNGVTAG